MITPASLSTERARIYLPHGPERLEAVAWTRSDQTSFGRGRVAYRVTGGRPSVVAARVGGLGIDPVEVNRLDHNGGVNISDLGQSGEDRHHHMAGIDFEEPEEG